MASPPPFPPSSPDPRSQRRAAREQASLRALAQQSGSVIGPIVLLAVGVGLFLVELGHLSFSSLFRLTARWAPLLLVLLGLLRLVEWFLDRRRLQQAAEVGIPAQPSRLSSGLTLVLFLLVVLSVAGHLSSANHAGHQPHTLFSTQQGDWDQLFGQRHDSDSSFVQPCPPGTALTLNLGRGNLTISGTSSDGQLHASMHTSIFATSDGDASHRAAALQPVIHTSGNMLNIAVPYSEGSEVDLTLTLPASTALQARSDHGDITVSNLSAPVAVTANHGDVILNDLDGPLAVRLNNSGSDLSEHQVHGPSSVSGRAQDITVSDIVGPLQFDGDIFGDLHLERLQGPLHLHTSRIDLQLASLPGSLETEGNGDMSADQITGPVAINTRNRNISLDRVTGPLIVSDQNGSITATLSAPLAPVEISNRNGEITLNLPESASFSLSADTTDADLTNEFGLSPSTEGSHVQLQGSVGAGVPPIHLHSTQADIAINKVTGSARILAAPAVPRIPSAPPTPLAPSPPGHSHSHSTNGGGEVSF